MHLASVGMVCSVGLGASPACAAMRAGISKFDELPYASSQGDPVVGAMAPSVDRSARHVDRLVAMLVKVVGECMAGTPEAGARQAGRVPLLVALAEPDRPGGGFDAVAAKAILERVGAGTGVRFHAELSAAIPEGHTAAFRALHRARDLLNRGAAPACVVCGVDSYVNATSLLWLAQRSRLKTEDNSDGVIPGEAAAAVLVRGGSPANESPAAAVAGIGFARESATVLNDEPLLGIGLADAARAALAEAGVRMNDIDVRLSDVTGERYGFQEQSLALSRVLRSGPSELPLWHCADSIGDTGAAAGACELVVASQAIRKGYARGGRIMCYTSAVAGDRAVVIVRPGG